VLTNRPPTTPPKHDERLTFTFIRGDIAAAVAQAKAAAGDKAVQIVGGVNVIRQVLRAGLADELHIDIIPVLLGDGLRLGGAAGGAPMRLERIGMDAIGQRTSLRFGIGS
jgi:dihydrofolate reductase